MSETGQRPITFLPPAFRRLEARVVALPDRFSRAARFVLAGALYILGFLLCFAVAGWWQEGRIEVATVGAVAGLALFGIGNIIRPPRVLRLQPTASALVQRLTQIGLMALVILLAIVGLILRLSAFGARAAGKGEMSTVAGILSLALLFVATSLRPRPRSRDATLLRQIFEPVTFPLTVPHAALLARGAARARRAQVRSTALSFALFLVTQAYSVSLFARVPSHNRVISLAVTLICGIAIFGILLRYRLMAQERLLAADLRDGVALRVTGPVTVTRRWYVNFLQIADERFTIDKRTTERLHYLPWGTADFSPYTHHLLVVWDANARPLHWPAGPPPDLSLTPVPT